MLSFIKCYHVLKSFSLDFIEASGRRSVIEIINSDANTPKMLIIDLSSSSKKEKAKNLNHYSRIIIQSAIHCQIIFIKTHKTFYVSTSNHIAELFYYDTEKEKFPLDFLLGSVRSSVENVYQKQTTKFLYKDSDDFL